jgi:hypothetical protein
VTLRFFDVGGPLAVVGHGIDAQADDLRVALGELRLQPGHVAEFGGAHGVKSLGCENRMAQPSPIHS